MKMEPRTSKMRSRSSKRRLLSSGIDFGAIFIDFLVILGRLLGSISSFFSHKFRVEFSTSFREAFRSSFGSIWEAFGANFRYFFDPKGRSERKSRISKKHEKPLVFIAKSRVGGLQIATFSLPRATFSTFGNDVDIFIDFCAKSDQK